jgi:hypothetical protein
VGWVGVGFVDNITFKVLYKKHEIIENVILNEVKNPVKHFSFKLNTIDIPLNNKNLYEI